MDDPVDVRLKAPGPKRMLALDGGGVKGILTLGYLGYIEALLRKRYGRSDLVLADYFDFIGGTSTGAIIASSLAIGTPVKEIALMYSNLAKNIFKKRFWRLGLLAAKFDPDALEAALKDHFGDITFDDPSIKTGLMVMAKRWDTGSPWVLHNVRGNRYYEKYTKGYLVRQVVRASTAAPSYFKAEQMEVAPNEEAVFVDGGVTPHNNPAFQMFMLASIQGYGLQWDVGAENLLLVSVGTGSREEKRDPDSWQSKISMMNGFTSLKMMMSDADAQNQILLQWLSNSPTARKIDSEIGALETDLLGGKALLHYLRYDAQLHQSTLRTLDVHIDANVVKSLKKMEKAENVPLLKEIGEKAAAAQVKEGHFPVIFDIEPQRQG